MQESDRHDHRQRHNPFLALQEECVRKEYMVRTGCQEVFPSFKSLWFKNSGGFENQFLDKTLEDFPPGEGYRFPVFGIGTNLLSGSPVTGFCLLCSLPKERIVKLLTTGPCKNSILLWEESVAPIYPVSRKSFRDHDG